GIRAAAGYLPGLKLGLSASRPVRARDYRKAIAWCVGARAKAIVLHGYSRHAERLRRLMRKSLGSSIRIYGVWHGSTAQFHYRLELESFQRLGAILRSGLLDGLA